VIQDTLSCKSNPAVTSDQWHVIRATWSGESESAPTFQRSIVSEHQTRDAAVDAARALVDGFGGEMGSRSRNTRDQIFVRPPAYKTLKIAGRRERRRPR
jgi:hypothetical protein